LQASSGGKYGAVLLIYSSDELNLTSQRVVMIEQNVEMLGKPIQVAISDRAKQQLQSRAAPLYIEMELYFSCLIRKQVRVYEAAVEPADDRFSVRFSDKLQINFRPVMTKSCSITSCEDGKPPLSDFPIRKPRSYIPRWLHLDFSKGRWSGDFGY